jgi:diguanylate cyclase
MYTPDLSLDKASALAQKAINFLLSHQIAPSPVNYAVAFEYHAGDGGELQQFLDHYLKSGKPLNGVLLGDLYERYVATDRVNKFNGMRNDLQEILQSLMQHIGKAGGQAAEYHHRLEQNIERLGGDGHGADTLHAIASDLMASALKSKQDNQVLQSNLDSARQEAEQLRGQLEQHRREALIDPLTGLYNRRALEQHMQVLWQETGNRTLSVLALDIDHFKRINDTYGHNIGDVVLRHVANTLRKSIRGEDIAVRFGGEEFLILLPDTPLAGAVKVAETIRSRVAALRLIRRHDNLTLDPFTISLGVSMRRVNDDQDSMFERADQALYQSKSGGRNRVTVEEVLH